MTNRTAVDEGGNSIYPQSTLGAVSYSSDQTTERGAYLAISKELYIIGGIAIFGIVVAIVVVIVLCKVRRHGRQCKGDRSERGWRGGNGIHSQQVEAPSGIARTGKTSRRQKEKRKSSEDTSQAIEMAPVDFVPDIITAHDTESISESFDVKCAPRHETNRVVKADIKSWRSDGEVYSLIDSNNGAKTSVKDSTYDHLARFTHPKNVSAENHRRSCIEMPMDRPTRPIPAAKPRMVKNAECKGKVMKGMQTDRLPMSETVLDNFVGSHHLLHLPTDSSLANSLYTFLEESVEMGNFRGSPIVCSVSLVGVLDHGKPSLFESNLGRSAYFVLEPPTEGDLVDCNSQLSVARPRFTVIDEMHRSTGNVTRTNGSEYFVLEPVEQQDDLNSETPTKPQCAYYEPAGEVIESGPACPSEGTDCLYADSRSTGCFGEVAYSGNRRKFQSVNCLTSTASPRLYSKTSPRQLRKRLRYRRSFSSPSSSLHGQDHDKGFTVKKKLDEGSLKLRIEREMKALGFLDDDNKEFICHTSEAAADSLDEGAKTVQQRATASSSAANASSGAYYTLELESEKPSRSENDEREDAQADSSTQPFSVTPPAPSAFPSAVKSPRPKPKPRFQRQQTATGLTPQRQRQAGRHIRTRSEAPVLYNEDQTQTSKEDEGPVIVSLKKFKSEHWNEPVAQPDISLREKRQRGPSFRSRFMSSPEVSQPGAYPESIT